MQGKQPEAENCSGMGISGGFAATSLMYASLRMAPCHFFNLWGNVVGMKCQSVLCKVKSLAGKVIELLTFLVSHHTQCSCMNFCSPQKLTFMYQASVMECSGRMNATGRGVRQRGDHSRFQVYSNCSSPTMVTRMH